jgi:CO/xanthine dehydrogenase Mo-binding subunit
MVKPGFKAHQPMVMAAEVEVDVETGVVKPIRLVTGTFPGRMINPGVVRGQALGAAAQALGMALWEELRYDEQTSSYLSAGFTDYRIPRALDMPEIETLFLEEVDESSPPHEGLPYGGRGVGEMTCWGAVVIASAIYSATGVEMRRSPMTAETVLEALEAETA